VSDVEVEDFKSATARMLGKLPRLEEVARAEGPRHPRVTIETASSVYFAFAADAVGLRFHGLRGDSSDVLSGAWREYGIDGEGNVVEEGTRYRIRKMDWDDGQEGRVVKSWPEFARVRKPKPGH
jgi:hypothetical protein